MRSIYTVIFYLLIPIILLRLLWRGWYAPAYWLRWAERFGFFPPLPTHYPLWIHAVSVGEVQAAIPLIQALRERFPQQAILVTTMTPTGSQRVQEVFGDSVGHVYLPYDLPFAIKRLLNQVQPTVLILMETELWINLLHICQQRAIPVILANARLSARSARGYQRIQRLICQTLNCITAIAAQTQADANRFIGLGASPTIVQVTGSIKFDSQLPENLMTQAIVLRQQLGTNRPIWIAASTHEGEEEQILTAFSQVKTYRSLSVSNGNDATNNPLLILVPRHPERFNRVASLCHKNGFNMVRRSENGVCLANTDIYLGDTMGELLLLYAASDVAFVGGSLVPVGGHNLLEPAAVGLPVITGQYVFNFAEISRQLLENQAAQQISDSSQLAEAIILYLTNEILRRETGEKARQFVQSNRGALERLLTIIQAVLKLT